MGEKSGKELLKMIPSVVVNLAEAAFTCAAFVRYCKSSPPKIMLRYFTTLSNLFCAAACLLTAVFRLCGGAPKAVLLLKFVGTAAVSVTCLTVVLFLAPVVYDYRKMLSGPDFWMHLACPVLAVASLLLWDRPSIPFAGALLGALPVVLYGVLYFVKVVVREQWEDFYGFNRSGKWYLSCAAMLLLGLLVSFLLWVA